MLATAAATTPGFWDWAFDPPLVLVIDLAVFYLLGARRTFTPARKRAAQRWRCGCFWASLAVLAIALASPIERLSARPVLGAHDPARAADRRRGAAVRARRAVDPPVALPAAGARRWLARGLSHGQRTAPLRALSRTLGRPVPSFVAFSVVLLGWHVPALFDATLESTTLHAFEHTLFFFTAVLFWKQVIPSAPLRIRLSSPQRVVFLIGGMIVSWALAVVLALAPHPLYSYYAHLASRPGGISAIADQQLAAGVMWVPGSVTFLIVLFVYVHRWLVPQAPGSAGAPRLASEH